MWIYAVIDQKLPNEKKKENTRRSKNKGTYRDLLKIFNIKRQHLKVLQY